MEVKQFIAADGTVLIEAHGEPGCEVLTFMPAYFERFTYEQWQLMRKEICEELGYPESNLIAQEALWGDPWRK